MSTGAASEQGVIMHGDDLAKSASCCRTCAGSKMPELLYRILVRINDALGDCG
jgi:hypothetical protein